MSDRNFSTVISKYKTKTVIYLPFNPIDVWGARQTYHITGTINNIQVRGPLSREDSNFYFVLGDAWRRDSGLIVGDSVSVFFSIEGPQLDDLAPDVAEALEASPQARKFFESLATFYRKGYLRWIDGASRRPELRKERIDEMVSLLEAGKKQR